jgi:ABC-2 type transport system ATP-binding protein
MTAIETTDLTKQYGSGEQRVVAVDGLDLTVEEGEVFGFLGPNGAGKSTTIDMLLDYARPTSGSATILGRDVHEESEALRHRIGVLPEGLGLYDRLSGRRHLAFAIEWKDVDDDPDAILERVGLSSADAARPVGEYSKGMTQRLALGMALVGDPDVLVLDEPSAGLDPLGIRRMRDIVREEAQEGTTVFFSSHVLGEVEAVCDRVGILADGRLVAVDDVERLRETVGAGAELRLRLADGSSVADADAGADAAGEAIADADAVADAGDTDAVADADDPAVDVGDVEAVAGVDSASRSGSVLRVTTTNARAKARVVARLVNAGVDVLDVDSAEPSLEDVFTAYTTGGSGDGDPSAGSDAGERDTAARDDDANEEAPEVTA